MRMTWRRLVRAPARDRWRWLTGGALAGCTATMLAWVLGTAVHRLARERGRRRRGRGDPRSGNAQQPSDRGRIIGPAHGQAMALRAARLFAAGAGLGQRRLRAERRQARYARQAASRHTGLPLSASTRSTSSSDPSRRMRRRHCAPCAASTSRTRPALGWIGSRCPTSAPTC